jgi:hypothetical protein
MNPTSRTLLALPRLLGPASASEHPLDGYLGGQIGQQFGYLGQRTALQERPLWWWHGHHHSGVDLSHVIDQSVGRQLGDHLVTMDRPQVPLQDSQSIAGQYRHAEGKQGRSRIAQGWDFAMQQVGQLLKMSLRLPTIMPPKRSTCIGPPGAATPPPTEGRQSSSFKSSFVVPNFGFGQLRQNMLI